MHHSLQAIDLHTALAALAENPELLERSRARFSEPQWYPGTPTKPSSPNRLSPVQIRRKYRASELEQESNASLPENQFNAQVDKELQRLGHVGRGLPPEVRHGLQEARRHAAQETVKTRWLEQGIWRKEWDVQKRMLGPWKHEAPDGNWNMDSSPPAEQAQSPKSDEGTRREDREREASRPYDQFIYQVSKERERILDGMKHPDQDPTAPGDVTPVSAPFPPDISTTAYERVKADWVHHTIWDAEWGVLPGMLWKHELSFAEFMGRVADDDPALASPEPLDNMHILANAISRPRSAGFPGSPSESYPDEGLTEFDDVEGLAQLDAVEGLTELDAVLPAPAPHSAAASSTGAATPNPPATRHEKSVALGPVHASRVAKRRQTADPARPPKKRAVSAVPTGPPRPAMPRRSKRLQERRDNKTAAAEHRGL